MGDYFATQADWANSGRKYAQSAYRSAASENISEASPLPREGLKDGEDPEGGELPPSESKTKALLQALGMVRGYCAMKPEEKVEEGGKKR
jgi:hypothetical protein